MKLKRLILRYFKGARSFELVLNGSDVTIFGDNAAGKTTIADSIFWLLFDKDSANRKDFEIKTLDEVGLVIPGQNHSVEATFEIDGRELTLGKVYREEWAAKRGNPIKEFSGHTTDYTVNTVPVQKKEYDSRIASIAPEERFRLLTDPNFFNVNLTWQKRRAILLEVCGDITDADVIASKSDLADLPGLMGQHSIDEYRKILKSKRAACNKEREDLPTRMDEVRRGLTDAEVAAPSEEEVEALRTTLRNLNTRRATIAAGGGMVDKTARIREIDAELRAAETRMRSEANSSREAEKLRARRLDQAIESAESELATYRRKIATAESDRDRVGAAIDRLLQTHAAEKARGFEGAGSCPSCGQPLPEDRIQAAVEAFNLDRSQKMEAIKAEGTAKRAEHAAIAREIEGLYGQLFRAQESLERLRGDRDAVVIPEEVTVDLKKDRLAALNLEEKASIEAAIARIQSGQSTELAEVDREISTAEDALRTAQGKRALLDQRANAEKRLAELGEREEVLAGQWEELERALFLTEEFIRTKVGLLNSRINSRFSRAQFNLFEEQVNGGLTETCEVTYLGVPFNSLNHGARLNVGLDIINVLGEHYGFTPPIVIDNAESVTSIIPTRGQQIRLVVSALDPTLRIQTHDRAGQAQEALL